MQNDVNKFKNCVKILKDASGTFLFCSVQLSLKRHSASRSWDSVEKLLLDMQETTNYFFRRFPVGSTPRPRSKICLITWVHSSNAMASAQNDDTGEDRKVPPIAKGLKHQEPDVKIPTSMTQAAPEHGPCLVPPSACTTILQSSRQVLSKGQSSICDQVSWTSIVWLTR